MYCSVCISFIFLNHQLIRCLFTADGQNGNGITDIVYEPPTEPIDFGHDFEPKHVECGGWHCCTVSTGYQSKCWGWNGFGQLGQGDSNSRGDEDSEMGDNLKIIDLGSEFYVDHLSCGWAHTCALSINHSIKCFGANSAGQLGYGHSMSIGDGPGEMGDDLKIVDLGTDFEPIQVECGFASSCALSTEYRMKCWGLNTDGQLGQGDTIYSIGSSTNTMGDNLTNIDLGTDFNVTEIRCGSAHVCALSIDATIKCFGLNIEGQLGLGDNLTRGFSPDDMGDNLFPVDLGIDFQPQMLGIGGWHSFAVSINGTMKAWGFGGYGNLGYGDYWWRGDHVYEMGDYLPIIDVGSNLTVISVSHSPFSFHTCAFLEDKVGSVMLKCFGRNEDGQIGLGDTENRGDDVTEMGDNLPAVMIYVATEEPTFIPTNTPSMVPTNIPTYVPTIDSAESEMDDGSENSEVVNNGITIIHLTVIGVSVIFVCNCVCCMLYLRKWRMVQRAASDEKRLGMEMNKQDTGKGQTGGTSGDK